MRRTINPLLLFVFFILSISTLPLTQLYATAYSASLGDINENSSTDTGGGKAPEANTMVQGIIFVSIPGGTFQMGSTTGLSYEQPVHNVTVSGFQMSRCEINQAQYLAVMGNNPAKFSGDNNRPVEQVSWFDAVTFCNKLSELAGLKPCYNLTTWECDFTRNGYRLPTEAEWEYACRAGTATKYYTGDSENDLARAGWYFVNSGNTTHAVGGKEPNAFGLYDMHGTVWEWCNDWYGKYSANSQADPTGPGSGANRISRGGGWQDQANECRLTLRYDINPGDKNYYIGFRVVRR